jgi:hypothetical protein
MTFEDVHASSPDGKSIECKKDADGPRWAIGQEGEMISRIENRVNVGHMDSSKIRKTTSAFSAIQSSAISTVLNKPQSACKWMDL